MIKNKDKISDEAIKSELPAQIRDKVKLLCYGEVGSTNEIAKKTATEKSDDWYVILSESQTKGKGRLGRSFFSPPESGIYMSILLRPSLSVADAPLITPAAAVAVCESIRSICEADAKIKWVNDILVDGKKVCGILTESAISSGGKLDYVVIGIGINVYKPSNDYPSEIIKKAGYLSESVEANLKNRLCAEIIGRISDIIPIVPSRTFINSYRRLCMNLGKRVSVVPVAMDGLDNIEAEADVIGIDDECGLILKYDDGSYRTMTSGEIRIKYD